LPLSRSDPLKNCIFDGSRRPADIQNSQISYKFQSRRELRLDRGHSLLLAAELPRPIPGDGSGYRGIPADGRSTASSARISRPAVSSYLRKKTSAPPTASPASVMPIARQSYRSRKGSVRHWRSASSSRFACPRQPIIAPFRSRCRRAASRPISCGARRPIRSCQHIRRATSKPRQRLSRRLHPTAAIRGSSGRMAPRRARAGFCGQVRNRSKALWEAPTHE